MISPIIEKLATEFAGKVVFGKLNIDDNPQIPLKYGVMSIPTLLLFQKNSLIDRIIGVQPYPILKKRIERIIKSSEYEN